MKSNEFRHLCDNVCSGEVSLLCFVKFVALVLIRTEKKTISTKLNLDMSLVSSNTESKVLAKKDLGWMREVFSYSLCKISRSQPRFSSFQNNFFFHISPRFSY